MKNPVYLIILLALGLIFVAYKAVTGRAEAPAEAAEAAASYPAIENIMTRTSVRAYTDRAIDSLQIDTLLRAAMAAPTAGNKQPWRFVVIDRRADLDSIAARFSTMKMASGAAAAIIVCGDVTATYDGDGRDYWIEDSSAAAENLLLAAHAMGLGAVWCGIYPMPDRVERFSAMLRLPGEIVPMACICLGYPVAPQQPKDKWKPEYVRYGTWQ